MPAKHVDASPHGQGQRDQHQEELEDKVDASLAAHEVDRLYLEWGLRDVDGLLIDGEAAEPGSLVASGPEELCLEVVESIKRECGLTGEERKN